MRSIRQRILLPLVPLLGSALLVTGMTVYHSVRWDLLGALDDKLLTLALGAGAAVDIERGGEVKFDYGDMAALGLPKGVGGPFYVVRDEAGALVASSTTPAPGPYPGEEKGPVFSSELRAGRTYRLCTVRVVETPEQDDEAVGNQGPAHSPTPTPPARPRIFWVTTGHPTVEVETTLLAFRRRLYLGFGGLFLALGALPAWIVSRALISLRRLSGEADEVGPHALDRRLSQEGVDQEVQPLVAALNRALDRLAAAYERQKRFTADAAHELRTPLSALRARCEVTLRRPREAAELREALEANHRTALGLGEIVESLLTLSRFEQGRDSLPHNPVDLVRVADEAVGLNLARAQGKAVALSKEVPGSLPAVGHHGLLVECVANLVENAVRHTPAGGSVRVGGGASPSPHLFVQDTGEGIPEEEQPRIFDRFYRVDKARSRADGGSGLGLSLAIEIARVHGGEITVESRPGEGSRFTLRLPLQAPGETT